MVKNNGKTVKICSLPTHIGTVLAEKPASKYMYESTLKEILQKIGNCGDCCYHVFCWSATEEQKRQLEDLEKKYSNFKVFYHVEHLKLMKMISQYDYGCCLWSGSRIPRWPEPNDSNKTISYSEGAFRYAMCNKYFDFISAGLPIITTFPEVLAAELEKKGILINMNLENFDLDYLREHKNSYQEKVRKVRDEFLIDNQIDKLIEFLGDI